MEFETLCNDFIRLTRCEISLTQNDLFLDHQARVKLCELSRQIEEITHKLKEAGLTKNLYFDLLDQVHNPNYVWFSL